MALSTTTIPSRTVRVLLVSREPSALRALWRVGTSNSWQIETAGSGWDALERVQSDQGPNLLILDLQPGDPDSLHTLRWLRRIRPNLPVVVLSYPEEAGKKTEAIHLGAQDYLVRPVDNEQLEFVLRRHLMPPNSHSEAEPTLGDIEQIGDGLFFVAASPAMRKLRIQAELLAQVNVPVLIVGESGSGKEAVAHLIHRLSVRSGCRFLKANCAAGAADLLENELFGSEPTAIAGATRAKAGKFELCHKGTILLDDISEMPFGLQARLLSVLQEKQSSRLSGESSTNLDVRVLASTNVNIEQALAERKLREDLYYRLSAFAIHVPPLRQRKDEIPLLLSHFMHQLAKHYGLVARTFPPAVVQACQAYSWPGNLRELENFVKRYLVIGDDELALGELGSAWESGSGHGNEWDAPEPAGLNPISSTNSSPGLKSLVHSVKNEAEKNAIAAALDQTRWNRKAAARLLQVSYRTLLYKIEHYHMRPPAYLTPYVAGGNGAKVNGHGN